MALGEEARGAAEGRELGLGLGLCGWAAVGGRDEG